MEVLRKVFTYGPCHELLFYVSLPSHLFASKSPALGEVGPA